jgi:hypothetical protein
MMMMVRGLEPLSHGLPSIAVEWSGEPAYNSRHEDQLWPLRSFEISDKSCTQFP